MTELLFLHSARRLMLGDTCILKRFSSYRADTVFVMAKVPREITKKV